MGRDDFQRVCGKSGNHESSRLPSHDDCAASSGGRRETTKASSVPGCNNVAFGTLTSHNRSSAQGFEYSFQNFQFVTRAAEGVQTTHQTQQSRGEELNYSNLRECGI